MPGPSDERQYSWFIIVVRDGCEPIVKECTVYDGQARLAMLNALRSLYPTATLIGAMITNYRELWCESEKNLRTLEGDDKCLP